VKREVSVEQQNGPLTPLSSGAARPVRHFRAGESVRDGLVRVASELIGRAVSRIESGGKNRAEDLHQVRLAVKRLRASLRLIRPVIGKAFFRRENRHLKRIADRLSLFRDVVVSRQRLLSLAGDHSTKQERKVFALFLGQIAKQGPESGQFREQCERAMHEAAGALKEAADDFQNMLIPAEEWEAIGPGLRKSYRRARNRMLRAAQRDTEEAFHEWRKDVKYLYYQLQLVRPACPGRLGPMARQLNRLEEKLGEEHDFMVLRNLLTQSPERCGGRGAIKRAVACFDRQCQKLRDDSEALGKELFLEKPAKFVAKLNTHWDDWRRSGEAR